MDVQHSPSTLFVLGMFAVLALESDANDAADRK